MQSDLNCCLLDEIFVNLEVLFLILSGSCFWIWDVCGKRFCSVGVVEKGFGFLGFSAAGKILVY